MNNRVLVVLGSVVGSFAVYCACSVHADSSATNGANSEAGVGGFVNPAHAEGATASYCAPSAPKFKKLASETFTNSTTLPIIPVGAFREVVVYFTALGTCTNREKGSATYYITVDARFRPDANTSFGLTGLSPLRTASVNPGGRMRVDGSDLQLTLAGEFTQQNGYTCTPTSYVVAGVE